MSNVVVRLGTIRTFANGGSTVPVFSPIGDSETLSSSASNAATSGAAVVTQAHVEKAGGLNRLVFRVANCGSDHLKVAVGASPDASTGNAFDGLPAGGWDYFPVANVGDAVAVVNLA